MYIFFAILLGFMLFISCVNNIIAGTWYVIPIGFILAFIIAWLMCFIACLEQGDSIKEASLNLFKIFKEF